VDDAQDAAAPAEAGIEPPVAPVAAGAPAAMLTEPQIDGLAPGMTIIRRVRRPPRWPGILACLLAVLMLAATGAGIQVAAAGDYANSTTLAYSAIALSVAAILFGIVAIVRRWGRPAGVVGATVAVLGNPLVLLYVLGSLSGS
jgi:hypothetical protein